MPTAGSNRNTYRILPRVTCPHCWEQFAPEKILWISEHSDLLGDSHLGRDESQRFLPTRFTVNGEALDARGFPCRQLACPKCHLSIPRAMLEMEPLFLSIFGSPASGKSYFLAAMTWELRRILGRDFALGFSDADPVMNQTLNDYEESLFVSSQADRCVPLSNLIRKTEEQGDLYHTVSYGNQTISYPRPFLFTMQPMHGHPREADAERRGRTVCLYDNAGESFQPGKDTVGNPVTRHLAHSRALFFVFDPTQDNRFRNRAALADSSGGNLRIARQEPVLQEAAARIRRHTGLHSREKHNRPLIVILSKLDAWSHLLNEDLPPEPIRPIRQSQNGQSGQSVMLHALDVSAVEHRSNVVRSVLTRLCPEIINAAEGFAKSVVYVPVSAVGWQTKVDEATGMLAIRPRDTQPHWVTVPLLYALCRWSPGLIPFVSRDKKQPASE